MTRQIAFLQRFLLWALVIICPVSHLTGADELVGAFRTPPEATKPRCYWYWFDDHVSKTGITRDLEAMREVGIGGAFIGIIGGAIGKRPNLKVQPLSDEWWENLAHAVREGTRLGVDIGLFNCPGWSQSGGPWVKPSQAMRYLVQEEIRLTGPQRFAGKVPLPTGKNTEHFQSVAVLAFRAPEGDAEVVPVTEKKGNTVRFEAKEAMTVRSLIVHPKEVLNTSAELLASDDGKKFRSVRTFPVARTTLKHGLGPISLAPVAVVIPEVTARYFRLEFTPNGMPFAAEKSLGEIQLSPAVRVEDFAGKALLKSHETSVPPFATYVWESPAQGDGGSRVIAPEAVIDLTKNLQADGTLQWDVPEGKWVLQHVGMIPTGTMNKPAPPTLTGFEADKLNRQHLISFFDAYIGGLSKRLKPEERRSWKYLIADSYETGLQNWTDGMAAEFQKKYGYNPIPYLPAIYGRVVGSPDRTERFLWDLRRMVADRVATEYVGGLRDLTHAHGMKLWLENYGHFGFPSEFMLYGANSDEIGGEFWLGRNRNVVEVRAASSASRVYGKSPIWAEAFTARDVAFRNAPRDIKGHTDWAFSEGINQFVLHVYIHQPDEQKPGINAWFGTEFNRHNTWFEASSTWIDYLRRCSVMLQSGHAVADFAVYITEDAPKMTGPLPPPIPAGHDYDFINADALLTLTEVRDGRLVLPSGASYAALILPDSPDMRPEVAKKIAALAKAGAKIIGTKKPTRSPSLQGYPEADAQTRRHANWLALPDAAALGLAPDVIASNNILWTHRRTQDRDIYFLSNQTADERTETFSFRVAGKPASLWNPMNAEMLSIPHHEDGGRSSVSLHLPPQGSVFVVFGAYPEGVNLDAATAKVRADKTLSGPWTAQFPAQRVVLPELVSWTELKDDALRYHSGAVVYTTSFEHTAANSQSRVYLDLGRVESLATVTLNGKRLPTMWAYPYRVDVSDVVKQGSNTVQIEVIHTWHNRLVGDAGQAQDTRSTRITHDAFKKQDKLQASGLLGPVRLLHNE